MVVFHCRRILLPLLLGLALVSGTTWAIRDRFEVMDVDCDVARRKFHQEARRECIRQGKQLLNVYPDRQCQGWTDAQTGATKAILRGKIECEIRM